MLFKIVPCLLKHQSCIQYRKYFLSFSRLKNSKSNSPPGKVLAAPSTKHLIKHEDEKSSATKSNFENSITYFPKQSGSSKTNLDTDETVQKEIKECLKPVAQPDIISPPHFEEKAKLPTENVKLLNTVKQEDLDWHKQVTNIKLLPKYYKSLSKFRLTGLVVITTVAGYGMAPGIFDASTFACMALGTALTSAAANTINQVLEVPYDSQMMRTKNRVLIRGYLTPLHASTFAACCASVGITTLYFGANSLTALLGATNLILYTSIYTPMKRYSIANTWLGSVVGAIPPVMGWAACTGTLDAGALLLGAILYSWQFPHFNALSWNLRPDYSRAGYRMTSVINPGMCRRVALRHSIALLCLCSGAPLLDLTTWTFAFDSIPLNCYLIYCAWQFHQKGDAGSARKLFRLSLVYLPALMFLMFVGKKYPVTEEKIVPGVAS